MDHITALDFILLPFYLGIFILLAKKMANRQAEEEMKKYLLVAFGLRMFGCFAYSMVLQYYYGYGDSFTYFEGGSFFREQISLNFDNITYLFAPFKDTADWFNITANDTNMSGYFATPANNMVMRISALISFIAFNKFLIISLFFGFFSFMGQWKLFLVFDDINKHRNRKILAFATLYSPSIWFWGSGLMKDSVCLGATGFIIYFLYRFFVKKKFSISRLLFLLFLIYIVSVIKSYITNIVFISIGVMLFSIFLRSVKSIFLRITLLIFTLALATFIIYSSDFSAQLNDIAEESVAQIEEFKSNYQAIQESDEGTKGGFGINIDADPSFGSLILSSPEVIFSCLFRPFLWESKKIIILFTSLESMLLFGCTLYIFIKTGIFGFFRTIFRNPFLLFCFIMSMLFALIIGFTTFNFGTMIRYKIIFLPFYYYLLVDLYTRTSQAKKKVILSPTSVADQ